MQTDYSPRSQTLFGNAIVGATLLRKSTLVVGFLKAKIGNGVASASAFPNRVWERGTFSLLTSSF